VEEELDLKFPTDVTVAEHPKAHLRHSAWSQRANRMTDYEIELLDVFLMDQSSDVVLGSRSENRWISEAEIVLGQCFDGQKSARPSNDLFRPFKSRRIQETNLETIPQEAVRQLCRRR
jgi:hypothetical protein